MNKKVSIFIFLSLFLLFSKEIKIKVIDKDLNIPLEGVKVVLLKGNYSGFTDQNGVLILNIDNNITQTSIIASLTGYESKKIVVSDFSKEIIIEMTIQGVIEGKELVIEGKKHSKKEEEVGGSKVIEKEELKINAMRGQIEDVISTVKILPGVSYGGKFNATFSVRGGNPLDFTAVYEGFVLKFPYHWGRGFSIFNPHLVDFMVFYTGIFPATIGPGATSILELSYKNPYDKFNFYYNSASSTQELVFNIPVGLKDAGILFGAKLTFLDLPMLMMKEYFASMNMFYSRIPYIYDVYLKWYWQPHNRFKWTVNGFFGSDGIGIKQIQDKLYDNSGNIIGSRDIVNTFSFTWYNYYVFAFTNLKFLPTDNFFIEVVGGYEYLLNLSEAEFNDKGKKRYPQEFKDFMSYLNSLPVNDPQRIFYQSFLDVYNSQSDKNYYYIDKNGYYKGGNGSNGGQLRINFENQIKDKVNIQYGFGTTIDFFYYEEKYQNAEPIYNYSKNYFELKEIDWKLSKDEKVLLDYYTFVNFNFNIIKDILKIETGLRIEHDFLFIGTDYSLTTYPAFSPRFNLVWTPVRDLKYLKSFSLNTGVALLSRLPSEVTGFKKEWGIKNFEIDIPKTLLTVVGFEFKFPFDITFKIEGYYKYFFHRLYLNYTEDGSDVYVHTDGTGHASGFDILLERKISRYIDGIITYSFIFVKLFNPESDGRSETAIWRDPHNTWYYPSYHRWHSLNIVLNIRPAPWITISPSFTFASGAPIKKFSDAKQWYAITKDSNNKDQVVILYSQTREYDDNLRSDISIPFSLKVTFNWYNPKSKFKTEIYIACDDIFAALYSPKAGKTTDLYEGNQLDAPEQRINFPMPSVGVKISF